MNDILTFKDDLLVYLKEQDELNPNKLVDITKIIENIWIHSLDVATIINDLFAHPNGGNGLITSLSDLGPMGFNQSYFNRHMPSPIKVRITPQGKEYLKKPTGKPFVIGEDTGYLSMPTEHPIQNTINNSINIHNPSHSPINIQSLHDLKDLQTTTINAPIAFPKMASPQEKPVGLRRKLMNWCTKNIWVLILGIAGSMIASYIGSRLSK